MLNSFTEQQKVAIDMTGAHNLQRDMKSIFHIAPLCIHTWVDR